MLQFSFKKCNLTYASFHKLKIKKTHFSNCKLEETDFSEADMESSVFEDCEMVGAIFERTNLSKTDFRTSKYFSIDPANNRMKGARFSYDGLPGLLEKYGLKIED